MTELLVVFVFILWYILSLILSENYGKRLKPGVEWLFFLSMVFSPIVGLIIILLKKKQFITEIKSIPL